METYYRVLEVPVGASFRQIKKGFRKAAAKYHPDSNRGAGNPQKFARVVEAYRHFEKNRGKHFNTSFRIKKRPYTAATMRRQNRPTKETVKTSSQTSGARPKPEENRRQKQKPDPVPVDSSFSKPKPEENRRHEKKPDPIPVDSSFFDLSLKELERKIDGSTCETEKGNIAWILVNKFKWLALPSLNRAISDATPPLKFDIIDCMAHLGDWASIMRIGEYLDDNDHRVICHALTHLKCFENKSAHIRIKKLEDEGRSILLWPRAVRAKFRFRDRLKSGDFTHSDLYTALAIEKRSDGSLEMILSELFGRARKSEKLFNPQPSLENA